MKIFKRKFRGISMRFVLILIFMILTTIPLMIQSSLLFRYFTQNKIQESMIDAQNECLVLANDIRNADYFAKIRNGEASPSIEAELKIAGQIFDGRIVVVDSNYKIVSDTFGVSKGKTTVVGEVLQAFNGVSGGKHNAEKGFYYVIQPIYNNSIADLGTDDEQEPQVDGVLLMIVSTIRVMEEQQHMAKSTSIGQFILLSVVLLLNIVAAALLLHPLHNLIRQIRIVSDGDMDQKVNERTYTETARISDYVNGTIRRLKILNDSRQEFVSNVSHELKTPITSIKVLADSIISMGDEAPAEMYREFMEDISGEITREQDIIEDLLTLVRMDKKTPDMNIVSTSINMLLEQILKRLGPLADKNEIELIYESAREVTADVDQVKLSLALTNLVENGIKYNSPGGYVRVSLDADHKFFYVRVSDNGIGIPEEFQDHVFERFYRVDKARSRETGGTGLGLAITKSTIMLHQGSIRLNSKEGEGTTFIVRIPLNYIL